MPKFRTVDEYHTWCEDMVTQIYYANVAMNDQGIRDVIEKIASVLHVSERDTLIAADDER